MRIRKVVAENEELVEDDVPKEDVDTGEQRPPVPGAAMRTSTTRRDAAVATA